MRSRLALVLSLLLAAARPGAANIFESDDRLLAGREAGGPFAAVVAVTQDEADPAARPRFGSGTLVSPCHVLTAHHIAFDTPGTEGGEVVSLVHLGPPRAGFPFALTLRAQAVLWGDLADHAYADWALLRLERCLGPEWQPWPLRPLAFAEALALGGTLGSAGHPAWETRQAVTVDPACQVHEAHGRIEGWWHDCAVSVGQSGGPIFLVDGEGHRHLVAIVVGDFSPQREVIPAWDVRAANVAVPVANFAPLLRAVLAAGAREEP